MCVCVWLCTHACACKSTNMCLSKHFIDQYSKNPRQVNTILIQKSITIIIYISMFNGKMRGGFYFLSLLWAFAPYWPVPLYYFLSFCGKYNMSKLWFYISSLINRYQLLITLHLQIPSFKRILMLKQENLWTEYTSQIWKLPFIIENILGIHCSYIYFCVGILDFSFKRGPLWYPLNPIPIPLFAWRCQKGSHEYS